MKFTYKHIDHNWKQGVYCSLNCEEKKYAMDIKASIIREMRHFSWLYEQIEHMSKVFHAPSARPYEEITLILNKLKL